MVPRCRVPERIVCTAVTARLLAGGLLAAAAFGLVGCSGDEITRYRVPKQDQSGRHGPSQPAAGPGAAATAAGVPTRTLAAIVPHGSKGWFFKLTGPAEAVEGQRSDFQTFIESLHFEGDDPPEWTLPEGWSAQPGNEMRYATLLIEHSQPPLEVSVTALGGPQAGQEREYLLNNVNRWRGQLGLAPIEAEALADETTSVECRGAVATVVDLAGTSSGAQAAGRPPFAAGTGGLPPIEPASELPPELVKPPEGWQPGRVNEMRKAAFDVVDGQQRVEITVIAMAKAGVALLQQVNRWRGQVGLPDIDDQALQAELETLPVNGTQASYIEAFGSEQAVLAAVVEVGEKEWFFKLMGDVELARRERERFRQFVQSTDIAGLEKIDE